MAIALRTLSAQYWFPLFLETEIVSETETVFVSVSEAVSVSV